MHQGAKVDALEGISDAAEEKRACDVVEEVGREADVHREEDMAEACSSGGAETDLPQAGRVVSEPDNSGGGSTKTCGANNLLLQELQMEYTIAAMGYTTVRAPKCSDNVVASSIRNVEAEMKAQSDLLAIENVAWPARQVWEERRSRFYDGDNPDVVHGLSESQVIRRVHVARSQHYSGNVHGSIEIPPLSLALDEEVSFFQLHYATVNRDNVTKPTCLLGWAHPALVALLRYHGTTLFVDGTFRCVPQGYTQCVIFMVHDRASVQATDQQLEPAEITRGRKSDDWSG
ncbi:hypothetical protein PC122_g9578 [Phytophthora cactorum]|nr:hypothetical protein PC122_g9578 [Phytophthora cactorum]